VLHGTWRIVDSKGRRISEIPLREGQREGLAVWWHPNGRVMREVQYEGGLVHGVWQEWREDGALLARDTYDRGRKATVRTEHYENRQVKSESALLEPALAAVKLDNWSTGELAKFSASGKAIRHGSYRVWHPNGYMMTQGEYKYDLPVGTFTWWYANGQRSTEGAYDNGHQQGPWSWWHTNGMRSIRGSFNEGNPDLAWTWWNETGKVTQVTDMSHQRPALGEDEPTLAEVPRHAAEDSAAAPPASSRRRR
jgi:antitoxin component YwqK of YwqJK toxin-antitoxin module